MSFLSRFRDFDVYSKPLDDFRVKTSFGGTLTLVSFLVIALLFLSEIWVYLSGPTVVEQLFVDSTRADMRVRAWRNVRKKSRSLAKKLVL